MLCSIVIFKESQIKAFFCRMKSGSGIYHKYTFTEGNSKRSEMRYKTEWQAKKLASGLIYINTDYIKALKFNLWGNKAKIENKQWGVSLKVGHAKFSLKALLLKVWPRCQEHGHPPGVCQQCRLSGPTSGLRNRTLYFNKILGGLWIHFEIRESNQSTSNLLIMHSKKKKAN